MIEENTIYLFNAKHFIENRNLENNEIAEVYKHPLFLSLCMGLKLEYVVYAYKTGIESEYIILQDKTKFENYDSLMILSSKMRYFVLGVIRGRATYDSKIKELEELGEPGHVKIKALRSYLDKRKKSFFKFVYKFEDVNQQIKIIDGLVYYLNPIDRSDEKIWVQKLKILKNSLNQLISDNEPKKSKESKGPLIKGKRLNLVDRYYIANEVLNIYDIISTKNITQAEKHILLGHILGCNQQTARELYNGTQQKRTKLNEKIVIPYLEKLK